MAETSAPLPAAPNHDTVRSAEPSAPTHTDAPFASPTPGYMLGAASASHGAAFIRQKIARRLARRAEGAIADSLGGGNPGAQIASAGHGDGADVLSVADRGFSGGAQEIPHRAEMEQSFGADFSGVRAYTDGNAAAANQSLHSHAYAMGDQVAFKNANPDKATVAHELTHVLQQSGGSPACKADGDNAIDTSGEGEAEAVEAAVNAGRPASSVLGGGGHAALAPARKLARRVARKEEEGGGKFGAQLTFSKTAFEAAGTYTLWKKEMPPIPTPIPGVFGLIEPSLVVKAKGGVDHHGANRGNISIGLGVEGGVLVGLQGGLPEVATIYGGIETTAAAELVYNSQAPAEEGHGGGHEAAAHGSHGTSAHGSHGTSAHGSHGTSAHGSHGTSAHGHGAGPAHAPAGEGKTWNLEGGIAFAGAAKIGVKLGPGGFIDESLTLGKVEIFKLTGIYFDKDGFHRDRLGFQWGPEIQRAFDTIKHAVERAKKLGRAAWNTLKSGAHLVADGASAAGHAIADGASAAGHAVKNGAKAAGHAIASGASSAGHAIASGASTLAHLLTSW